MTHPACILAAGLRPTEPAPAERPSEPLRLAWEVRPERVSVQTADGSEMRDLHAVYIEGNRRGYQATRDEAEEVARELANDPVPSTFGTAPDASIPSAVERIVADGHGNEWAKCERADCDLHVCRPGKAQCNHVDCELRYGPLTDALTREQTRHAITRDAHAGLVSALREQTLTWQRASIEYASRAEWARDPAAASMQAHAARLSACARELEALLAGHTGMLTDDDAEMT